uniref:Uncharacterized protein n=1 Tax=Parascaris equorum TaxID=6256 RepID=A0A914S0U3_PAREQ
MDASPIPTKYMNAGTKKESADHVVVDKIRSFSENTTAHGVRRIFIARNAYTARLWLLGLLFCLTVLIIQAHHLVKKFGRYEKITSIEPQFELPWLKTNSSCVNPGDLSGELRRCNIDRDVTSFPK